MTLKENNTEIRIYVACLAAYNNAILHGKWIDAAQTVDELNSEIQAMLKSSPIEDAEEFAIHDHEGFEGVEIGEYTSLDYVADVADLIAEHGELGAELIKHYDDVPEAREAMEDSYIGAYASVADYAQDLTEETTDIPKSMRYYIDYDSMGRDMEMNGDILVIETGFEQVHLFWGC